MRTVLLVLGLLAVVLLAGTSQAADPVGPFCLNTDQAGSLLAFSFLPNGGDTFLLSGKLITAFGSVPAMGTGYTTATNFHMGAVIFLSGATRFLTGNISLSTLTGTLACEDVDGGCAAWHISGAMSCP
jgi:hypothetical protein